jgi:very-short-patch-repair endonuclease
VANAAWARVVAHTATHHGVIAWRAAVDLGAPKATIAGWIEIGRLCRPAPGVLVLAGSPPTWRQRAAIAAVSGGAWTSHRTAATLRELDGFPPRQIEVVTLHGRRRKRTDWIVHESRTLRGVDLDEVDGIACTSTCRTLLDLPATSHPFLVTQALDHACRRQPGTLEQVVQRHVELPRRGRPGTRLMDRLLGERLGTGRFADSGFETRTVALVRRAGLPDPVLQYAVRDGDFVAFLDLAWPDIRWAIECDSLAHHSGKRSHEWDRTRRRRLKRLGWDVVEVTYHQVTRDGKAMASELRELYELRRKAVH